MDPHHLYPLILVYPTFGPCHGHIFYQACSIQTMIFTSKYLKEKKEKERKARKEAETKKKGEAEDKPATATSPVPETRGIILKIHTLV